MTQFRFILFIVLIITFNSCSEWLDVNEDPDSPTDVSYQEFLASGISSAAYVIGGKYQVLGALWSQHWTQSPGASQYTGLDSYDINSSTFDENQFGELYSGALQSLEVVRTGSLEADEYNYYFIATVMQCYVFQVLADLYDQIPFSEALKADDGISEPIYELGSDVYDSLIARIDYALSLDLDADDLEDPEDRDLIFSGDMDKWIAFANTLKLKIYLRESFAAPQKAQTGITNLYNSDDVSFLNTDVMVDLYTNESGRRNPLYGTEIYTLGGNNLILSYTLYSFLYDNGDYTRLDYLFDSPEDGGSHKALIQGNYYAPEESSGINSSSYSTPVIEADDPVYLMSLSEADLLQAEAIMRYGVDDYSTAKDFYEEAIEDSYIRVLYPNYSTSESEILAVATTFINGVYAFPSEGTDTEDFIESIATQKWLSLSGIQNLETFFELNRTGYPVKSSVAADDSDYEPGELTVSVNNVTSGKFPQRLIFPESEYASNSNTPDYQEVWETIWWNVK